MVLELNKDSVIDKILEYEQSVFNEFIQKRTNLLKNIKENIDLSKLNKKELLNFINDFLCVFLPLFFRYLVYKN